MPGKENGVGEGEENSESDWLEQKEMLPPTSEVMAEERLGNNETP